MTLPPAEMETLLAVMARLRDPAGGCAWDLEQTFATIAPYTVEEAYEVADAIQRGDLDDLKDELGDLLFQVVFHARMAEEQGAFAFGDVVAAIVGKMIRRHPHIFGDASQRTSGEQVLAWEEVKAAERAGKAPAAGLLDDIPAALPGLTRAVKLSKRAAGVGFVWPNTEAVLDKLDEELAEFRAEVASGNRAALREEFGDVLFVMANIARDLDIDPEDALREANDKFVRRFRHIESRLSEDGRTPAQSDLAEMDSLWDEARAKDKSGSL